jgi:hypothetical protein
MQMRTKQSQEKCEAVFRPSIAIKQTGKVPLKAEE